jgi:putative NIF3 family GTP cyclohydrolase 1 type 2
MNRDELARHLDQLLDVSRIRDYCPNGLQVEGRPEVARLVSGVTASVALIERAAAAGADALLVHHGYFWKGEDPRLVGPRKRRIERLLAAGIYLFAYHLPLDLHPEVGNNAQLGRRLGLAVEGRAGEQELVAYGALDAPTDLAGHHATERFGVQALGHHLAQGVRARAPVHRRRQPGLSRRAGRAFPSRGQWVMRENFQFIMALAIIARPAAAHPSNGANRAPTKDSS